MIVERVCIGDSRGFTVYSLGKGSKCIAIYSPGGVRDVGSIAALNTLVRELREREPRFRVLIVPQLIEFEGPIHSVQLNPYESRYLEMVCERFSSYLAGCDLVIEVIGLESCEPHLVAQREDLALGLPLVVEEPRSEILKLVSKDVGSVAQLRICGGAEISKEELLKTIEALRTVLQSYTVGGSCPAVLRRTSYVYAPYDGVFVPETSVGSSVVAGDVIGSIYDRKIRAPIEGVVLALSRVRRVSVGNFVALIAR